MTRTQVNVLGWILLALGWSFNFSGVAYAGLPCFVVALGLFTWNLVRLWNGDE